MEIYKQIMNSLAEAENAWHNADHFVFVVMPVVKDNHLLIKVLESLNKSAVLSISCILKFEYLHKRINLIKDPARNLEVFFSKCAYKYDLNEEDCRILTELIALGKKHKKSGVEFTRLNKVIILDDNLESAEISLNKAKQFLAVTKKTLVNSKKKFAEKSI